MKAAVTSFLNALAALGLLAGAFLTFRTSVLWLTVASLVTLAVLKRTRPLWIAPFLGVVVTVVVALLAAPIDIKLDRSYPRGVWMATPTWGLRAEPVPRDARGVPAFWWGRTCVMPPNAPEKVMVIGLGSAP